MATGDLKGNLCKMEQRLRLINYPTDVDYTGLAKGDPSVFLPIISYCFTSFSTYITELVMESGVELTAKNDSRFVDAIYKVKSQTEKRSHSVKSLAHASFPNQPDTVAISTVDLQQKPQVQRHKSVINMHIPEDFVSDTLKEVKDCVVNNVQVLDSGGDALDNIDDPVVKKENEVEVLKSQLAELQQKFHTLNSVEEKLETLEKKLQGKVVIEENEWNNLLSRVLLLETRLLLHSKTADISVEFNNMREEDTSSRNMTPVSSDKEKVELPESLHQSSGYSSLLSADPSPKAMAVNDNGVLEVSKETTIQKMERINKMIEETSELLKTSRNTSSEYSTPFSQITETNYVCP
ncbi:centrosomal protein of 44 kDa isoform X2 [Python bivittatus]|uniref:Centrosomal protein of 44 kDa n=1 Tax=Python bivittatus TaxID=176946 RepID=A0A9F5J1I8_PYTBI|nr:centrosomal protein of 44 kDa isoform X2 [Python bivittatus]